MAELDVQPKKNNPWLIWLILAVLVVALIFYFRSNSNDKSVSIGNDSTATDTSALAAWDNVDWNASETSYEEITDTTISVRGNKDYTIYGLGENILFNVGDTALQASAQYQLKQIAASVNKRYKEASLAVYGRTDSTGTAGLNKELGKLRAEAVKQWLVENANINADNIAVYSKGQSDPVASNATPEGRQMNRRVDIVARAQK
ncbi:OmpA family protein [Dyadobacter flavalbus]|uniref:OmpA family protein n=1 Tax=Dyadobacter flavalbus TaxID=2579942 RepID=A0A5M8QC22_9BACT|nr:OmpA family protein [Dyadobacter flavalbus]KAA6432633.1 OmpA family protein [Dyadobacter flavalbus]